VYLNPINFGMTQGSNGSSQLGVGTMRVNVNNSHQLNQDFTKMAAPTLSSSDTNGCGRTTSTMTFRTPA
jgi:hypothetical protein